MKILGVIPARLASTRLPRKVLRSIAGRAMLERVYEAARTSTALDEVVVATDADEVAAFCQSRGWPVELTPTTLNSGTERVHEVARRIAADVYVNVQGDEPLTRPEHVDALVRPFADPTVEIATLKTPMASALAGDPNVVKVVTDRDGCALYFSRAPIPWDRDRTGDVRWFKHLGFYAYRRGALDRFRALGESALERAERLEQLRFLENGMAIRVEETPFDTISVDVEEDIARVEAALAGTAHAAEGGRCR